MERTIASQRGHHHTTYGFFCLGEFFWRESPLLMLIAVQSSWMFVFVRSPSLCCLLVHCRQQSLAKCPNFVIHEIFNMRTSTTWFFQRLSHLGLTYGRRQGNRSRSFGLPLYALLQFQPLTSSNEYVWNILQCCYFLFEGIDGAMDWVQFSVAAYWREKNATLEVSSDINPMTARLANWNSR